MIELRSYQHEAVAAVEHEIDAGRTATAVVLPTGTGKTTVLADTHGYAGKFEEHEGNERAYGYLMGGVKALADEIETEVEVVIPADGPDITLDAWSGEWSVPAPMIQVVAGKRDGHA